MRKSNRGRRHDCRVHAMHQGFSFAIMWCISCTLLSSLPLVLSSILFVAAIASPCEAADPPVEAGRDALEEAGNFPWYDADTDSVRRIDIEETPPPEVPNDWVAKEKSPRQWKGIGGSWTAFWKFFEVVAWFFIGALLVGLVLLAVYILSRREELEIDTMHGPTDDGRTDVDRVENLPFPVQRKQSDLLGEARRQYEKGNYTEAVIYLYSYQLIQLDRSHLIRLAKGKTNRQYLSELRSEPLLADLLSQTIMVFEDVFFGDFPLERQRFELSWNRLDEFHQLVDQQTAA